MVIVRTWAELISAGESGILEPELFAVAADQFKMLHTHLGPEGDLLDFDLTRHGPLWLTTQNDKDLSWESIVDAMRVQLPEFVERHTLNDGRTVFRVGFLADNDFMALLVALSESLAVDVAEWLAEEACEVDLDAKDEPCNANDPF